MIYKFENFGELIFENPNIEINSVTDNYNNTCNVSIKLTINGGSYVTEIGSFEYTETWEDEDVWNYINERLKDFEA